MDMLDRDGDVSVVDDLASDIRGADDQAPEDEVIEGMFGGKRRQVEARVSGVSGVSSIGVSSIGVSSIPASALPNILGSLLIGAMTRQTAGGAGRRDRDDWLAGRGGNDRRSSGISDRPPY